jgi:hypothetical protein
MNLQSLRALHEKATPGEWQWQTSNSWKRIGRVGGRDGDVLAPSHYSVRDTTPTLNVSEHDAELIVAMRNALPDILARLELAEKALGRVETLLQNARGEIAYLSPLAAGHVDERGYSDDARKLEETTKWVLAQIDEHLRDVRAALAERGEA